MKVKRMKGLLDHKSKPVQMNINHNNKITLKLIVLMTFPLNLLRIIHNFNNSLKMMILYLATLNRSQQRLLHLEINMMMRGLLREPSLHKEFLKMTDQLRGLLRMKDQLKELNKRYLKMKDQSKQLNKKFLRMIDQLDLKDKRMKYLLSLKNNIIQFLRMIDRLKEQTNKYSNNNKII